MTVVNDSIGTLTGMPTGNPTVSLQTGETLYLNNLVPNPSQIDGNYTINYKIVNNTGRGIAYYGFTNAEAVTNLEIPGIGDGGYTVYVWLQKNNEIHSHEGTWPEYFTLTVDGSGNTYGLALDTTGIHNFGIEDTNYIPANLEKDVSIITTGSTSNIQVRLSGDNKDDFVLSNESGTGFTISPDAGLGVGVYKATVAVTGDYAQPQSFNMEFEVKALNDFKAITGFTIPGQQGNTTIDDAAETIALTMPAGTDVTSLTPTITHTGASVSPDSGVPQDFTSPVTYTVTAQDTTTKDYIVTVAVASAPPSGSGPSVSTTRLTIAVDESKDITVSLGTDTNAADSATVTSGNYGIATATPTQLNQSGEVRVTGITDGNTIISIGYSGGIRDGEMDQVQVTVTDDSGENGGNTETPGGSSGGSSGSTRSGWSGSSGGSTYTPQPKTQLPASAFSWDGDRTLTINHDSITTLGLLSVQWDGKALTRGTDYGVYQGSVIVRFGADFIAGQSSGDHTVRLDFLNHTGETTVTVGHTAATEEPNSHPDNDTYNPNTGGHPDGDSPTDNPNTGDGRGVWFALLLGSIGAAALVKLRPRRETH